MKHLILLTLFFLSIDPRTATALPLKEGFNERAPGMPQVLEKSWGSVFLVLSETPTTYRKGTASLIRTIHKELVDELFFLTNDHVILKDCPTLGKCDAINLIQEASFEAQAGGEKLVKKNGVLDGAEIVKASQNPDLAVIRITVPRDPSKNYPSPLKISRDCALKRDSTLYTIGFSSTPLRVEPADGTIADQYSTHKRWSEGRPTHRFEVSLDGENQQLIGTTIDLLPGGSGGPVLNQDGEVVAVMKASNSLHGNDFAYTGHDSENFPLQASAAVGCESLNSFLEDILNSESCLSN